MLSLDARLRATADEYGFTSTVSLFDYDIVFWDPALGDISYFEAKKL